MSQTNLINRIAINLIVHHPDSGQKWANAGQHELPVLPRIGEHVAVKVDEQQLLYRVVDVFHAVPFAGLTEVFAIYDGTVSEVQNRMLQA